MCTTENHRSGSSATFSNSALCPRVVAIRGTPGHQPKTHGRHMEAQDTCPTTCVFGDHNRVAQEIEHASKRLAFRLTQARCEVAVKTSKALSNSVSVKTRLHLRLAEMQASKAARNLGIYFTSGKAGILDCALSASRQTALLWGYRQCGMGRRCTLERLFFVGCSF